MYLVTQAFLTALQNGEKPIGLLFLQSRMGRRVYAKRTPTPRQMGSLKGLVTYDGSTKIGDGTLYGSANIILDWGAYLINIGDLRETLSPEGQDLLGSLTGTEIPSLTATLNNAKGHFSNILIEESFLTQIMTWRVGFPSLAYGDFLEKFQGIITDQTISGDTEFIITAQAT